MMAGDRPCSAQTGAEGGEDLTCQHFPLTPRPVHHAPSGCGVEVGF